MCGDAPCGCDRGGGRLFNSPLTSARRRPLALHVYRDALPSPSPLAAARPRVISSQTFRYPGKVSEKMEKGQFDCLVSPTFYVEGQPYEVLMDGHHRFIAALLVGAQPNKREAGMEHGISRLLASGDVLGALKHQHQKMGPYKDAITGEVIWKPGSPYFMEA